MKSTAALALIMSLTYASEIEKGYGLGHGRRGYDDGYGRRGYDRPYKPSNRSKETVYAKCMLKDPEEENYLGGTINFVQEPYGKVNMWGNIWGVKPGLHGFHVHTLGDLRQGCASMAGHWNAELTALGASGYGGGGYGSGHGYHQGGPGPGPYDGKTGQKRFVGDLKVVQVNKNGDARVDEVDPKL